MSGDQTLALQQHIKPETPPSLAKAALGGLCPQCGSKTLFVGMVSFAPRCGACGLDYSTYNVGDGPAAFLALIVGGAVTAAALVTDALFRPPFWVHMLLWIPITAVAVIGCLRLAKAALLYQEYRNRSAESERDEQD